MPRRPSARAFTSTSATPHAPSPAPPSSTSLSSDVVQLRQQWKWAAFSQFFFTFATLFNMGDVSLVDIESDLTRSTSLVLPRIMQRLLYTLSQDRKINLDNWQTALRKQYFKRDPQASPLGPEPSRTPAPDSSPAPETMDDSKVDSTGDYLTPMISTAHPTPAPEGVKEEEDLGENAEGTGVNTPNFAADKISPSVDPDLPKEQPEENSQQEETKDWLGLPMLTKLDSMHLLTEWQFQNPQRVRTIMKNDDEGALWRIEPIGYDAKSNAYWLIGADRLWIQRAFPKPKPPQTRKRKRAAASDNNGRKAKRSANEQSRNNKHLIDDSHDQPVTLKSTSSRSRQRAVQSSTSTSGGRGGGRAAKTQAKMKLDAQAKELAEFQRQLSAAAKNKGKGPTLPPPPKGTRLSKRLRGSTEEDEWQPIPEEWLTSTKEPDSEKDLPKTGLESDDESALTSLSDEDEDEAAEEAESEGTMHNTLKGGGLTDEESVDNKQPEIPSEIPADFIEWETIAVTLYEWEHIAERFEKATHYTEKALYKVLMAEIVPVITAELKEIERQRQLEEALVHRKRSSRIAIKESEKEEAELAAKKKAEEEEKMSRARRLEARQQKEEAEREKRETAREQRRREREQREQQPRQVVKKRIDASADMAIDVVGDNVPSKKPQTNGFHFRKTNGSTGGSGTRTPAGEDWELDCEICLRRGINQDDDQPMMSCGICSKWQHISCHDNADLRAGRPKRNWDAEEFICQRCRSQKSNGPYQHHQPRQYQDNSTTHPHIQQSQTSDRMMYVNPIANFSAPRAAPRYAGVQAYATSTPSGQHDYDNFRTSTSTSIVQRPYQAHPAITFAHYQPDPQGFSTRQTYQRDLPIQSSAYLQQPQYPPFPSQQQGVPMTLRPPPLHQSPSPYGNGVSTSGAHPQNYTPYSGPAGNSTGQAHRQDQYTPYVGASQWQAPRQSTDPRVQTAEHFPQHNPAMSSTLYQLPH